MKEHDDHKITGLKANWPPTNAFPIQSANMFSIVNSPEERTFYLTIGSAVPLVVSAEEREMLSSTGIDVQPIIRIAISESRFADLIKTLQRNYDRYIVATRSADEGDDDGQ